MYNKLETKLLILFYDSLYGLISFFFIRFHLMVHHENHIRISFEADSNIIDYFGVIQILLIQEKQWISNLEMEN